jgi:WD40 repeat protein
MTPEEVQRKENRTKDFAKDEALMEGLFTSDEARTKRCLALLENHLGPVNCVRWNGLGTMFASADDEGTIILWEYRGHTVITAF